MRYTVNFEDETKEYSVVDRMQSMKVVASHPALEIACDRASEENERWRIYTKMLQSN